MGDLIHLENIPVSQWSESDAFNHLRGTFDLAVKAHPEIMTPFVDMLLDAPDNRERTNIMREGLRSTINLRYPIGS